MQNFDTDLCKVQTYSPHYYLTLLSTPFLFLNLLLHNKEMIHLLPEADNVEQPGLILRELRGAWKYIFQFCCAADC